MGDRQTAAPVIPAYGHACISDIVPVLLGTGGHGGRLPQLADGVADASSVVLLVLDGLGWLQLQERRPIAPALSSMSGERITSVAPTTTAAALTSISTGLAPSEHGIIGYRMHMGERVMNVLRWGDESFDLRSKYPPRIVQSCPPFLGRSTPVLSKAELEGSGFTEAHLDGVRHHGWRVSSSIAVEVGRLISSGEKFVYAYYDGIDKIAHERGFGDFYDAELASADRLVEEVLRRLPSSTALVVTADHGQVHVGEEVRSLPGEVARMVGAMSGEGRFRWLHARSGTAADLLTAAAGAHGSEAWVVSREQVIDEKWFGPPPAADVRRRMGDVALVAWSGVTFDDPSEGGGHDLVCRHGSLTPEEMYVPLLWGRGLGR